MGRAAQRGYALSVFPPTTWLEALRGRRRWSASTINTTHEVLQTIVLIINWQQATYYIQMRERNLLEGQIFHRSGKFTRSDDGARFRPIFA